jgi:hypothetical protein
MRFDLQSQASKIKVSPQAAIAQKKAVKFQVRNVKTKYDASKDSASNENKKNHCESKDVSVPRDSGVEIAENDEKVVVTVAAQCSPPSYAHTYLMLNSVLSKAKKCHIGH